MRGNGYFRTGQCGLKRGNTRRFKERRERENIARRVCRSEEFRIIFEAGDDQKAFVFRGLSHAKLSFPADDFADNDGRAVDRP